jgi:hypothetical protein
MSRSAPYSPADGQRGYKYDLRSNIGQQHGSQGTLFHVTQVPRETVGPRGYSPARQQEVRNALDFVHADALAMEDGKGYLTTNPDMTSTSETKGRRQAAKRDVQDMIAKTSAPMPTHNRLDVKVVQNDDFSLRRGDRKAAGFFTNPIKGGGNSQITVALGALKRPNDPGRSQVLTHELGHVHSWDTYRPSSIYDTPEKQGTEEAYADDFAVAHTPQRIKGLANHETPYPDAGRGDGFRQSYDGARTTHTSLDSALGAFIANPNVPGGGKADTAESRAAFVDANPALPGMEKAEQWATNPSKRRSEYGPPHFEGPRQFENRVSNRQDAAIKGAS